MASFGRYELREELGRGGMATVYRAFDPAMEREVALKVLPLEFTHDPTFVGRFLREAKIIARLDHLHIVPVYDVGQENEQPYLIMRLLAGGSLHERLASQGPFSLAQALPILDQIAAALDFAHARGIIHRDLKPSNILFDSQGQVFVSDFGIAKLLASTTAYTGTGIIGTPDYMSPEQAQATGEIDARSDVYSLGIMTYQMLTGSLPYRADTPVGLALAHVTQPVPSLRAVNPQFSEAVDGALRRALAKNPADRYSRASDFVAALRAASEGRLAPTVSAPVFEARPQPAGSVAPTSSGQPATGIAHPPRLGLALAGMGGLGAVAVCLVVFFVLVLPRMGRPAGSSGAATPTPAPSQATAGPAQLPTSIPPSAAPTQTATAPATAEGQVEIGGLSYDKHPGATVTIAGSVAGQQAQLFQSEFDEFSQATGITVQYESLPDFETAIQARVEGNNAPDIALLAQPSLLDSLARQGKVVDLNSFMSASFLQKQYAPSLLDMATVDGKVAAVWHNADIKSLVWYPKKAFDAAGYQIPQTWEDMLKLSDQIVADGGTPWCIGIESGAATGWVGTDWVEDVMLRTTTPDNYDRWTRGELKFDSPEVKNAFDTVGQIWFHDGYVYGGTPSILTTNFGEAPLPMLDDPPKCWLHRQASFIINFLPQGAKLGEDISYFYLPPIDPQYGKPVLGSGSLAAMFDDRPDVREVMTFLATGYSMKQEALAGVALAPQNDADSGWYPNDAMRGFVTIAQNASILRFDASDLMPGAVGAGSFWTGIVEWVKANGQNTDRVLTTIDASWPR